MFVIYKVFGKSSRKVNETRVSELFQWNISRSNRNFEKVVLFSLTEFSKRKFVFHLFKTITDTGFKPSLPFFGNWTHQSRIVCYLPKRWTDETFSWRCFWRRLLPPALWRRTPKACYIQLNYKYKTNSWTTEYSCKGNNKIRSPVHLMFWAGFYCLVILRRSFEWNLNSCLNKHYQVTGKEEKKKNHVSTWKDKIKN